MKAIHGYRIIEIRNGQRIEHFPHRTVKNYEVARIRIVDLVRNKKWSAPIRYFEIWDGMTALTKITVTGRNIVAKPYLLQPRDFREAEGYERDFEIYRRPRVKNQKVGNTPGDLTNWVKCGAIDKKLCTIGNKANYSAPEKIISRTQNKPERLAQIFAPKVQHDAKWFLDRKWQGDHK